MLACHILHPAFLSCILYSKPHREFVRQLVSPPQVGGDKGEGETNGAEKYLPSFPPPPLPSPIKGEGFLAVIEPSLGKNSDQAAILMDLRNSSVAARSAFMVAGSMTTP